MPRSTTSEGKIRWPLIAAKKKRNRKSTKLGHTTSTGVSGKRKPAGRRKTSYGGRSFK